MAVGLARVQPGAQPFNANNINDTWLGVLYLADGSTVHAILKDIYPKEMANELLGAALASALGLPVPQTYLAVANPDVLAATKGPSLGDFRVVFASERKGTPPLKQVWTGERIPQPYLETLLSWPLCGSAFAFDTWAANVDRNVGNILCGGPGDVWLIDHGQLLTGPMWNGSELAAGGEYLNKMSLWLTNHFRSSQKAALLRGILELPEAIRKLDLDAIAQTSKALSILTAADAKAMLSFLKARVDHISPIATKQAGIPRLL